MDDLFGEAPASSTAAATFQDEEYESVLFVARECCVYKVPPRTSTAGYKAAEWGDMEAFLWKGRCRVMEVSQGQLSHVTVRLEDSNTGELFAQSPVDKAGKSVEPVLDSSRYFVLKVVDINTSKHAYLGMGFQERSEAFDFQVALQDWQKRQRVPKLDPTESDSSSSSTPSSPHIPSGPKRDFSLKEGQTINVKLGSMSGTGKKSNMRSEPPGGGIPLLAPPPPAARKR
ncbi:MAG: hypothetical protein CYPHOPRED_002916 [Cyphobasidiales sp. Tagirdzhanova-0007]|nr:MAG: hypothetical protein CYPHOPRED_002916 [Cyphobasidiales sp. Tagirdzhanova-0007]